ncbi:hypothetical protein D3C81_1492900 [compost metagenome]
MRKTANAQQQNRGIRAFHQADARRADHAAGTKHQHHLARGEQRHLQVTVEQRAQVTAEHATDVGSEERQPGEHRHFLDVHVPLSHQVQRDPGIEGLPGRLRKNARRGDGVEVAGLEDALPGALLTFLVLEVRFLARKDVVTFVAAQALLIAWVLVEQHPQHGPDDAR